MSTTAQLSGEEYFTFIGAPDVEPFKCFEPTLRPLLPFTNTFLLPFSFLSTYLCLSINFLFTPALQHLRHAHRARRCGVSVAPRNPTLDAVCAHGAQKRRLTRCSIAAHDRGRFEGRRRPYASPLSPQPTLLPVFLPVSPGLEPEVANAVNSPCALSAPLLAPLPSPGSLSFHFVLFNQCKSQHLCLVATSNERLFTVEPFTFLTQSIFYFLFTESFTFPTCVAIPFLDSARVHVPLTTF